jgi:hypothetical protein
LKLELSGRRATTIVRAAGYIDSLLYYKPLVLSMSEADSAGVEGKRKGARRSSSGAGWRKIVKETPQQGLRLVDGLILLDTDDLEEFLASLPKVSLRKLAGDFDLSHLPDHQVLRALSILLHPQYKPQKGEQRVQTFLDLLGFPPEQQEELNPCLVAAIAYGFVKVKDMEGVDKELLSNPCFNCKEPLSCSLENALFQASKGLDYGKGGPQAAVLCQSCGIGNYITGLCIAQPRKRSGLD